MNQFVHTLRSVALYSMLLMVGLYAGLHFTGLMNPSIFGVLNAEGDLMPAPVWAASWQLTDGFMRVRMDVFGPMLLFGYVLTVLLFIPRWRNPAFSLLLVSFGLFMADVVLTLRHQIPINRYIQKLDFSHLTPQQVRLLEQMHPQVINNFNGRAWYAILGFVLLALAPFFWTQPSSSRPERT